MQSIILASQSPRRKQLLEWAQIPFEVVLPETDEQFPLDLNPTDAAIFIAKNKAQSVKNKVANDQIILAADTIVVLNGIIIGKPADREDAIQILHSLSGIKHQVITGVVISKAQVEISFSEITEVEFYPLTSKEIEFYVDQYKPFDKAGAYAIQEWIGVIGIKAIQGDFYNVMGLPISTVVKKLNTFLL